MAARLSSDLRKNVLRFIERNPEIPAAEVCRRYNISYSTLKTWEQLYAEKMTTTQKHGVDVSSSVKRRPCLRCHRVFWSMGVENRICRSCKDTLSAFVELPHRTKAPV